MEEFEGPSFERKHNATTKKRNQNSRQPRTSFQCFQIYERSTVVSGEGNTAGDTKPWTKEFNLSQCTLVGDESKVKRVKLKVGSVTHTIGVTSDGSSKNTTSGNIDSTYSRSKPVLQVQEGKIAEISGFGCQGEMLDPVRKSKRLTKRNDLDEEFDDAYEDDEIRYLKKLKCSKFAAGSEDSDEGSSKKLKRISRASINAKLDSEDLVSSRSSRSERGSDGTDYEDGIPIDSKQDMGLTTRQRSLLSSKGGSAISGGSEIEFPYGLPPAHPKKQKEKLSEADQLLKKTEAAQRRKMLAEKAARESEAEAIRKILGQDSNRKKREDKIKKRMEDLAQEKATSGKTLASNTIRLVIGPAGTVLSFSTDLGLPSIFYYSPCNYPAPRENCAGPSCTNPYKYRDSKSKLPLCSLQCYKAVREKVNTRTIL